MVNYQTLGGEYRQQTGTSLSHPRHLETIVRKSETPVASLAQYLFVTEKYGKLVDDMRRIS